MQKSTSSKSRKVRLMATAGALGTVFAGAAALVAGVSPAMAATLASQPDTQVAVFMVPLTLLLLVLLFEVARFARRGKLPAQAPVRGRALHWGAPGSDG